MSGENESNEIKYKPVYQRFYVYEPWHLGSSPKRQTVVYKAIEKTSNLLFAVRFYDGSDPIGRPNYIQWAQKCQVLKFEKPYKTVELLPYSDSTFEFTVGDPGLTLKSKLVLMFTICKEMKLHHANGMVHGNLKPSNILISGVKKVDFVDSLPNGNLNTYYASPQNKQGKGVYNIASDVYSLGLLFLELLSGDFLQNSMLKTVKAHPCFQPFFPQEEHLNVFFESDSKDLKQTKQTKTLLKLMLARNHQERINVQQAAQYLKAIVQNNKQFKLEKNLTNPSFRIYLHLIEEEKKQTTKGISPFAKSEESLFKVYGTAKQKISFTKDIFTFAYTLKNNELNIECAHPAAGSTMSISYREDELPKEVSDRMGLRRLVLTLYHSPEDKIDFCLTGKLKLDVPDNSDKSMCFPEEQ